MRKIISLLICLIIISLFTIPALAEERSVIGINLPFTTGIISYEKESQNNNSWIIGGFLYAVNNNDATEINLSLAGGMRFYNGSNKNRYYKGLYGTFDYDYAIFQNMPEPYHGGVSIFTGGIAGVFGYEWRFGEAKNPRFFFEGGFKADYCTNLSIGFNISPVIGAGLGF